MTAQFHVEHEIVSQPELWERAAHEVAAVSAVLPVRGARVAVVGCGTSWFIGQSYAEYRERSGAGETDAFAASEFPATRPYDLILAISRSGTTTEVIDALQAVAGTASVLITGVPDSPAAEHATHTIVLDWADEQSVVQTRFATTVLALLRAHLGEDVAAIARDARSALAVDVDDLVGATQVTFVGRGAAVGLCNEAALKAREAAQLWTEAYPAMDYRHGPISIAEPGRLVWAIGAEVPKLSDEVQATGARYVHHDLDELAGLVVAQRFAVAVARQRGLDADQPRSLTRSVVLTDAAR